MGWRLRWMWRHSGMRETCAEVGLAAGKKLVLTEKNSQVTKANSRARYDWKVAGGSLVDAEGDWDRLRVGVAVAWGGGPQGTDRQRERFRHLYGAAHAGLSASPEDWQPLNLAEYEQAVSDRKNRIGIDFDQPMDGRATIVIEDEQGRRVRNLVSGETFGKGKHSIDWDGLDEEGRVAAPAGYRWRSIHHPAVRPEYLFSFCNDGTPPWRTGSGTDMWGPDHSVFTAAASNGEWCFFGGSCRNRATPWSRWTAMA